VVALGVAACGGSSSTQTATTKPAAATTAVAKASRSGGFAGHGGLGGGSNARSTNAEGGSVGTVSAVASSGFTLSPPKGGAVTVKETASTVYEQGTRKTSARAVTKGAEVLVVGNVNSTTITASRVVVKPAINLKSASANVIGFQRGEAGGSRASARSPRITRRVPASLLVGPTRPKPLRPLLEPTRAVLLTVLCS
jgi:hypothetical protein